MGGATDYPSEGSAVKFTDRYIKNLKPESERYERWEGNGLGIRVSTRGRKSWIFLYRFAGKARRMTLGSYPQMSVAEAHEVHGKAQADLARGIDPGAAKVEANRGERIAPTVTALANEYIERWAKPRKRSWLEDQRILAKDVLPRWGDLKAKDVTRRHVIALLDDILERGAPIQANRALAVVRKMFNFAIERGIVETSPCTAVRSPAPEQRRDRILCDEEILAFWHGLEQARMAEGTKLALQLQLLTAQRCGEVVSAVWDDFDLSSGWWTIPAGKAKNNLTHRVPLSPPVLEVLARAKAIAGDSAWVFPSPRGAQPMTESAMGRAIQRNLTVLGIEHFTPHDLRRTAASHMTSEGISRLVVAKVLNHVENGITAVYDRHSYDAEKRQALEAWATKLDNIINRTLFMKRLATEDSQ